MNSLVRTLFALGWLLLPTLTVAQSPTQAAAQPATQAQMYEDIEIMRQLLGRQLQPWLGSSVHQFRTSIEGAAFSPDGKVLTLQSDRRGELGYWIWAPSTGERHNLGTGDSLIRLFGLADANGTRAGRHAAQPAVEGTYIKGHGVVFTMALPSVAEQPTQVVVLDKRQASDWERVRREVRGETEKPAEKQSPPKLPSLTEVLLKLLADNGRHFSKLAPNENLTLIVTFREPATPGDWTSRLHGVDEVPAGLWKTAVPTVSGNVATDASGDHNLLGDLHFKQGRFQDAINAYQKALEQKPPISKAAEIQLKIAQAYLGLSQYSDAQLRLTSAKQIFEEGGLKQQEQARVARNRELNMYMHGLTSSFKDKLIITAPKQLLDQVGSGQISFDEFSKRVSVEKVQIPKSGDAVRKQ